MQEVSSPRFKVSEVMQVTTLASCPVIDVKPVELSPVTNSKKENKILLKKGVEEECIF